MPEYLAPGVYVEEIDTGSKPIEGVSTSTTGLLGVTERGPVNVPILVTSYGEFVRWFGERLNALLYSNGNDRHCYLPHAVEGFFTNGGKRLFVTRVLDVNGATHAAFPLHDRGTTASASTMLLRGARELTGVAASPLYVLNVNAVVPATGTLANADNVRIGGGSDAEYRIVDTITAAANATHVPLSFPLNRSHDAGIANSALHIPRTPIALGGGALSVSEPSAAGDSIITVEGTIAAAIAALAVGQIVEIGDQFTSEHRFINNIIAVDATHARLVLDGPLARAQITTTPVVPLDSLVAPVVGGSKQLDVTANPGDRVVYVLNRAPAFTDRDELVIVDAPTVDTREVRRIGNLSLLILAQGTSSAYPAGSVVHGMNMADDGAVAVKVSTAPVFVGSSVITVNNRVGLAAGSVVRIGIAPTEEYATIAAIPNPSPGGAAPNAGNLVLTLPLNREFPVGTDVQLQTAPAVRIDRPATVIALDVATQSTQVPVTDGGPGVPPNRYLANDLVRIATADGTVAFYRLDADAAVLDARPVSLTVPLAFAHSAGSPLAERTALLRVQAIDAGIWGDRLRVSIEDEGTGLVSRAQLTSVVAATQIRLSSISGVESGTILELLDPVTSLPVGDPIKVSLVDRANNLIVLDPALSPAQVAAAGALPPGTFLGVRSREFSLTVRLLRQPDATTPTRNETVIDSETFRYLSMDHRHSRYVQTVIGDIDGPLRLSDRRPEGESWYIRVRDAAQDLPEGLPALPPYRVPTLESIRLGPEPLLDVLPDGRRRPARHPLFGGNDSLVTLGDVHYLGVDSPNPENRTGLHSLRNVEEISIVGCPGRTGTQLQQALIIHCELMRYRFAVLDGRRPPNDTLSDVQNQRQQYDTKYAALYHPWMLIPDPFPQNLARISDYAIPPSGHVLGIYARTDIERGVHKAPANEVVRGISGLQRVINKEQHDILNPYPVNINVIRDFRANNRAIRVFGGRVITSDSDMKYVNVRRLLIFLEASIDRGLQWVVFEPNAEPLWARVKRSITNFLNLVWRNGALEGTKQEEAFFVKCDRTTMTQTDIDSGRLICIVGVAPVKPAEFAIVRIGLFTARAD